jgi:peptidoglycan DL-endopeptidase CwlO
MNITSSLQSNRKGNPISNFLKRLFQLIWGVFRALLRGENLRLANSKIHSFQFHLISFLRRRASFVKVFSLLREYAATIVVAICVGLVALVNLSSSLEARGSLFGNLLSNQSQNDSVSLKNKALVRTERQNNLATAPLSTTNYLADTEVASAEYTAEESDAVYAYLPATQNQMFLASANGIEAGSRSAKSRGSRDYQVKDGDTIGRIAALNGVSANTILWANKLDENSIIKPGDKLTVLPVTGVNYKVQKGDSIAAIAKKYSVDEAKIIAYNELPANGDMRNGQELVIPDGYIAPPQTTSGTALASASMPTRQYVSTYATAATSSAIASSARYDSKAGAGHRFPYGYCTWYVAQRKYVPWGGNAISWLANARAFGKATGRTPQPGAIVVTGESRWGHVAVVESVKGNSFTVSEMNYVGFGKKSTRTLSAGSGVVKGFIY